MTIKLIWIFVFGLSYLFFDSVLKIGNLSLFFAIGQSGILFLAYNRGMFKGILEKKDADS